MPSAHLVVVLAERGGILREQATERGEGKHRAVTPAVEASTTTLALEPAQHDALDLDVHLHGADGDGEARVAVEQLGIPAR